MTSAFRGLVTTAILVGAGALVGLFWEEVRVWELAVARDEPASGAGIGAGSAPAVSSDLAEPMAGRLANRIKIEVLNGAGERGLARQFADRLRALGFDVVATGNAEHFDHEITHVLDRSGRLGAALEVARDLHTDSVVVALNAELYLDASVVVGKDWVAVLGNVGRD